MEPLKQTSAGRAHDPGAIDPLNKGIGLLEQPIGHDEIVRRGWNLLREDLTLPSAVLYEDALQHNLEWMRHFTAAYGVRLAPHGKTTMAPRLFDLQLRAGAWGITLATAHQTQVAYAHGVRRVLMANQLIGKQNMTIVAGLLRDREFEFYCLIDSAEQVGQLGSYFSHCGARLNVLLEVGVDGGRPACATANSSSRFLTLWANGAMPSRCAELKSTKASSMTRQPFAHFCFMRWM